MKPFAERQSLPAFREHIADLLASQPATLVVADTATLQLMPDPVPENLQLASGLRDLAQTYWRAGAPPSLVITPLMSSGFDVIDVRERLLRLGFRGTLLAVAPRLADRSAVLREIRTDAEAFEIQILEMPAG